MWKQKQQIPSADLSSHSVLTVTCSKDLKPTQKNTHSAPSPPRTSHRNRPVSIFSNCAYVSLIHLYPRDQRLRNQTETLELDGQTNVIFLGKQPCVAHADIRTWPGIDIITYRKPRNILDVSSQQCTFQHLQIQPAVCSQCGSLKWNITSTVIRNVIT